MLPGLLSDFMNQDLVVGSFSVDFNPTVGPSSFAGVIVGNRTVFTVTYCCHPVRGDTFFDQVVHHRLSSFLRKGLVTLGAASAIGVTLDAEPYVRVVIQDVGDVVKNGAGFSLDS